MADILETAFSNAVYWKELNVLSFNSLTLVLKAMIDIMSALVQVMVWRRTSNGQRQNSFIVLFIQQITMIHVNCQYNSMKWSMTAPYELTDALSNSFIGEGVGVGGWVVGRGITSSMQYTQDNQEYVFTVFFRLNTAIFQFPGLVIKLPSDALVPNVLGHEQSQSQCIDIFCPCISGISDLVTHPCPNPDFGLVNRC